MKFVLLFTCLERATLTHLYKRDFNGKHKKQAKYSLGTKEFAQEENRRHFKVKRNHQKKSKILKQLQGVQRKISNQ